jgi:hypothetical protein
MEKFRDLNSSASVMVKVACSYWDCDELAQEKGVQCELSQGAYAPGQTIWEDRSLAPDKLEDGERGSEEVGRCAMVEVLLMCLLISEAVVVSIELC